MISKDEVINMMDGFLSHYDNMDLAAHNRHDKRREDYAVSMWCVCHSLKLRIRAYFREHKRDKGISEQMILDILDERREHYAKVMANDLKAGEDGDDYRLGLYEDHKRLYENCPVLKRRLMTAFKNRKENKK